MLLARFGLQGGEDPAVGRKYHDIKVRCCAARRCFVSKTLAEVLFAEVWCCEVPNSPTVPSHEGVKIIQPITVMDRYTVKNFFPCHFKAVTEAIDR